MENVLGCVLMAGVTLPVSYFLARGCLRRVLRIMAGTERRDVL
jgi:hypothetical protein